MTPSADRAKIEQTLFFVAQRGWQTAEADFLTVLVAHLAETLDVEFAFVGRLTGEDRSRVETVALSAHGEIVENITYDLKGTPCENVVGKNLCCHVRDVQKLFPENDVLTDMSAESYVGIPLWASDGHSLGHVVVLGCSPLKNPELVSTVLQIVAVRAAAEIERELSDKTIRESKNRFRDFAEIISDWMWEFGPDLRCTWVSGRVGDALPRILGKTPRELGQPDDEHEQWARYLEDISAHRPIRDVRVRRAIDGKQFHFVLNANPIFGPDGEFRG